MRGLSVATETVYVLGEIVKIEVGLPGSLLGRPAHRFVVSSILSEHLAKPFLGAGPPDDSRRVFYDGLDQLSFVFLPSQVAVPEIRIHAEVEALG
jgi:hypothetical protein